MDRAERAGRSGGSHLLPFPVRTGPGARTSSAVRHRLPGPLGVRVGAMAPAARGSHGSGQGKGCQLPGAAPRWHGAVPVPWLRILSRRRQAAASPRVLAGGGLRMSRRRLRLALKDARSFAGVTSRCN